MSEQLTCALCGIQDHDVKWRRLVEWTDDHRRQNPDLTQWDAVDRCLDYQACRRRVEERDRAWPVRDVVTRPTMKPSHELEEVPI